MLREPSTESALQLAFLGIVWLPEGRHLEATRNAPSSVVYRGLRRHKGPRSDIPADLTAEAVEQVVKLFHPAGVELFLLGQVDLDHDLAFAAT